MTEYDSIIAYIKTTYPHPTETLETLPKFDDVSYVRIRFTSAKNLLIVQ